MLKKKLSLEDEDDDRSYNLRSSRSNAKSKPRSSAGTATNPRASKRARLSGASATQEDSSLVDKVCICFYIFCLPSVCHMFMFWLVTLMKVSSFAFYMSRRLDCLSKISMKL